MLLFEIDVHEGDGRASAAKKLERIWIHILHARDDIKVANHRIADISQPTSAYAERPGILSASTLKAAFQPTSAYAERRH